MDFLKKHYEKVLLGVVMLALAVAVGFLPVKIASEKRALEEMANSYRNPRVTELTNLNLTLEDAMLKRVAVPAQLDLSAPHRLFNPMPWQKAADGHLIKVGEANIGPNAIVITKMVPLYLTISLNDVTVLDSGPRCKIGIENEAATSFRDRRKEKYCKLGDKNETFSVREIKPLPSNPTNFTVTVELNDNGKRATISKNKPFRRVEGYMVDLKYPPESKVWTKRRVGDDLSFNGETYNIVAITENEVVLSAKSNQKKWTIKYNASASAAS
jgi:hypothetical protein